LYGSAGKGTIDVIEKMQKKIVRNVKGTSGRAHTNDIFIEFGFLKIRDMIEYNRRIFGHGVMHGIMPESIRSDFEHVTAIGCTTRAVNGLNLKIPFCKKSLLASAPSFTVPTAWNTLNLEIKKVQKARSFKKLLQKDYFDRYRAEPSCSRTDCYSCAGLSRGHGRSVGAGRI